MPDSLLFAGGSNSRIFSAGQVTGTGALSVAAIVKRTGADGGTIDYSWFLNFIRTGADSYVLGLVDPGLAGTNLEIHTFNGTDESEADPTVATPINEWYLVGISKASGTATPRYHIYRYSTATWEHGNCSTAIGNYLSPDDGIQWVQGSGESLVGNLLIGAVWDSVISDATYETLAFEKGAWIAAAPDEAYRFDTMGTITPFVGTGTQTISNGGTLDTGDAPEGWIDSPITVAITADANDGGGYKQSNNWATIGIGAFTVEDGDSLWVSKTGGGVGEFFCDCSFLRFDTSAIPDDAVILSAYLEMYVLGKDVGQAGVYYLAGDYYDFGGEPSVAADWLQTASPSILNAVLIDALNVAALNTFDLTDVSGISKTGFTGIRLTLSTGTPAESDNNSVSFASYEHATNQEPRLVVTYVVPSVLDDTGLVTRYYVDEASGGDVPTEILDASPNDYHLDQVVYGDDLTYFEDAAGNRGLDSTLLLGAQRAIRAMLDSGDPVRTALSGIQKATVEVVVRPILGSSTNARVFCVNDQSGGDTIFGLVMGAADSRISFWWEGGEYGLYTPSSERHIFHFVMDTTLATATDRCKVYVDGIRVTNAALSQPTQNETLTIPANTTLGLFNRNGGGSTWNRAPVAMVYYAAIYTDDFDAARIWKHANTLLADDDTPFVEPPEEETPTFRLAPPMYF